MSTAQPDHPLATGLAHRWRRPGRIGENGHQPGRLGARSVRFAGALVVQPLPQARLATTGPVPGDTLAAATRSEVPVHRLSPVQAAGSMVVPRDLVPLQPPSAAPVPDPRTPRRHP